MCAALFGVIGELRKGYEIGDGNPARRAAEGS